MNSELVTVEVVQEGVAAEDFDYSLIADPEQRDWAESAAGMITFGLGQAVVKVLEAGHLLIEAKQRLAHGEYLPWVEQACGLKRSHASQLIKAANWANVQHVEHLNQIGDTATLFLLSADATPEDVRQWALERCAARKPPTRKEVLERKRSSQGKLDRTLIQEALAVLKLSAEARALAAEAKHISTRELLQELDLDELPKGREHKSATHVYCKNGNGWWKFPSVEPIAVQQSVVTHIKIKDAAILLGFAQPQTLTNMLTPSRIAKQGYPKKMGYEVQPSKEKGMCYLHSLELRS